MHNKSFSNLCLCSQADNFFTDIYQGVTVSDLDHQQMLVQKLEYVQKHLYPMRVDFLDQARDKMMLE